VSQLVTGLLVFNQFLQELRKRSVRASKKSEADVALANQLHAAGKAWIRLEVMDKKAAIVAGRR